jgi:hypothetical protein
MTFFFDTNISEHLVNGLKAFGESVVHLKEMFDQQEPDASWLRQIGEKKFFLVTRDERVRFNPIEMGAIRQSGVGAFFSRRKEPQQVRDHPASRSELASHQGIVRKD